MSWVPAEVVLKTVAEQKRVLAEEQEKIFGFEQYHATERATLTAERAQATHDLGQALLPSLDPRVIASAAETSGLIGLPSEDVPAKVEARRVLLASRIREIEHDTRYANRELLRHPHTGSLTRAIAEAEEMRQPASGVISACENHPRFARLWESGFGTEEFHAPWWRYSYWEDRSAATEVVGLFQGKTTFEEVRKEYQSAKDTLAVFDADLARLRRELAGIDALAREHDAHVDEYRHLDTRALEHTRGRIVDHLLGSDVSLVSQRLQPLSAIRLLFLRASGISAKIGYLDGLEKSSIAEAKKELDAQRMKMDAIEARTRRRWAPMDADKYAKLAIDRRPRYEKRWQRVGKAYETVYRYDRWDRGRYYDDLLWWDVMTRGRYDGSFLPDVVIFHERHPDYVFDPDYRALALSQAETREREDEDAAAAAAIEADDAGPDDLVQADAS